MKLKCILIDHDDTSVDSTPHIHHISHLDQMRQLGRESQSKSLEQWFTMNYHPGIHHYLSEVLNLSPDEEKLCYSIWRKHTLKTDPPFFPGILTLLSEFSQAGGIVAVVSHSETDIIERHYTSQREVPGYMPDIIYGWDGNPERNKPSVWPVRELQKNYNLNAGEMVMIDDLRPGITMARIAGIRSIGAGWSHSIVEIHRKLAEEADLFFDSVEAAATWVRAEAGLA